MWVQCVCEALRITMVWATQYPEFGKPGQVCQFPSNGIDACLSGRVPLRSAQIIDPCQRLPATVAQCLRQPFPCELARVIHTSRHDTRQIFGHLTAPGTVAGNPEEDPHPPILSATFWVGLPVAEAPRSMPVTAAPAPHLIAFATLSTTPGVNFKDDDDDTFASCALAMTAAFTKDKGDVEANIFDWVCMAKTAFFYTQILITFCVLGWSVTVCPSDDGNGCSVRPQIRLPQGAERVHSLVGRIDALAQSVHPACRSGKTPGLERRLRSGEVRASRLTFAAWKIRKILKPQRAPHAR